MPRVDFYILSESASRENFSCDLAAKIQKQNLGLHIQTGSRDEACRLDDLLWTFRDISFVPHSLCDADDLDSNNISLGWPGVNTPHSDVLLNLDAVIPNNAGDFDRVVEIVPPDESYKAEARQRYKHYRDNGYELHNHDMR